MKNGYPQWGEMTDREKLVWATTYGRDAGPPVAAVQAADRAVLALRTLDLDQDGPRSPEADAARANVDLSMREFANWYRVQYRIANGARSDFQEATEEDCNAAYERYQASRADFY